MLENSFAKMLSTEMRNKQLWFAHRAQIPQFAVKNSKQLGVSNQPLLQLARRDKHLSQSNFL